MRKPACPALLFFVLHVMCSHGVKASDKYHPFAYNSVCIAGAHPQQRRATSLTPQGVSVLNYCLDRCSSMPGTFHPGQTYKRLQMRQTHGGTPSSCLHGCPEQDASHWGVALQVATFCAAPHPDLT